MSDQKDKSLVEECRRYGVESDLTVRWKKGAKHHPKSVELMKALEAIDFELCGDYFCWKSGGDGDNGETLMYEMDVFFELEAKRPNITDPNG